MGVHVKLMNFTTSWGEKARDLSKEVYACSVGFALLPIPPSLFAMRLGDWLFVCYCLASFRKLMQLLNS